MNSGWHLYEMLFVHHSIPVEGNRTSPVILFMFHCLHFPLNNGLIHVENVYSPYGYCVFCVCFFSPCPRAGALSGCSHKAVARKSQSFHALALYCHLKSSKGEGKNKADKTTRENPEIMGALEVPNPPWRTDRAL